MAAYAKVLKDTSGNQILPYTRAKCVYMDDNTTVQDAVTSLKNNTYTLPTASSSTLGGVKIGSNISNSSGTISLTKSNVINALGYTPTSTTVTDIGSNIKCMSWARIYDDMKIVKRIGNFIYFYFGITKSNSQSSDYSINPGTEYELAEFSLANDSTYKNNLKFFPQFEPISCFYKGYTNNGGYMSLPAWVACLSNIVYIHFSTPTAFVLKSSETVFGSINYNSIVASGIIPLQFKS